MPIYYPGTTNLVTKSFEDRNLTAEFDDALCDQQVWKNSRYEGSKLISKKINVFTESGSHTGWPHGQDKSFTNFPNIQRTSTALYIANTVIGGLEDPQYADIAGHSYININKILLINPIDQSVQVLEQSTEPYAEFHRFITNDFHTGTKFRAKVIDPSVGNSLKIKYTTKMNKGWLLKSFDFNFAGELYDSASVTTFGHNNFSDVLTENNSMYLYRSGSVREGFFGSSGSGNPSTSDEYVDRTLNNRLRFRYGVIEMFTNDPTQGRGHHFTTDRMGPSFASSSIIRNKYTSQYFSGSFGFIRHKGDKVVEGASNNSQQVTHGGIDCNNTGSMGEYLSATGLGSASRFLGIDTIEFLKNNNQDTSLKDEEKTELFITFFQGTKDFAPGVNDERSISTFEVDFNFSTSLTHGVARGSECNDYLPINQELIFKGNNDGRLLPTTSTYNDTIINFHAISASFDDAWHGTDAGGGISYQGCVPINQQISSSVGGAGGGYTQYMQSGVSGDKYENIEVYVQGGALGEIGYQGASTASATTWGISNLTVDNFANDNFYSGSFNYDVSFLDKAHTIIADIDKDTELYEGIGSLGLVLMPENSDPQVAFNVEYYLEKAGIIPDASDTIQRIAPDLNIE
jgi:hypothetical protein